MTTWDEKEFVDALLTNPVLLEILERADALELDDCHLTGGAVFQTIWNQVTGRPPTTGIGDYDLFYSDPSDLSVETEGQAVDAASALYADLGVRIDIKNQARVHLWYEARFGLPAHEFTSSHDAIDHFVATTCCFGVRRSANGFDVYAPHGFDDVFEMVLRPNHETDARAVYEAKAAKWQAIWPELVVMPWNP